MWTNRVQVEGNRGPGLIMPVLLPLLVVAVVAVWGLYGSALRHTIVSFEETTRASLSIDSLERAPDVSLTENAR